MAPRNSVNGSAGLCKCNLLRNILHLLPNALKKMNFFKGHIYKCNQIPCNRLSLFYLIVTIDFNKYVLKVPQYITNYQINFLLITCKLFPSRNFSLDTEKWTYRRTWFYNTDSWLLENICLSQAVSDRAKNALKTTF